jgi:signal transduction histidine kinase/GAF domain-containing protein
VAALAATEAIGRLELLATLSQVLDSAPYRYQQLARRALEVCVPSFADLGAVELVGPLGKPRTVAYKVNAESGLHPPRRWGPVGVRHTSGGPLLIFPGNEADPALAEARRALGAESLLVVPITWRGITAGCFLAATGPGRRAFRPSALQIAQEIAGRLATALERAALHEEAQAAADEQARAVRRLRRLATAGARLAGAATSREVLEVACAEARALQQAEGAAARWWTADGRVVEAMSGRVDEKLAETAFEASAGGRVARGRDWTAYPLLPSHPRRRAALVVFRAQPAPRDDELALSSLASLVPVAFERAVGTGAALAQEARVRAVVSSSPVALVGLGRQDEVVLANPAAQRLFGWAGTAPELGLPDALAPTFVQLAAAVEASGHEQTAVVSAPPYELSLSAAPMPAIAGGGDELRVLVAATDLSEVKRAERSLVQAERLQAMALVAGRVAHDFNNLLTVILGYTDLLQRSAGDEASRAAAANIARAAGRAASLTQQLLGMAGGKRDGANAGDLAAQLREMVPALERLAGDVVVSVSVPPGPVPVAMVPSGAEQVVLNLALNALQALGGHGHLDIHLSLASGADQDDPPAARAAADEAGEKAGPRPPWAVLTVTDTGPGMTEEVLARCQEPFFTTKQGPSGTGLGLPSVHGLVSEAGGQLAIRSAPGEGTTVEVRLPVVDGVPVQTEVPPALARPADQVSPGRAWAEAGRDHLVPADGLASTMAFKARSGSRRPSRSSTTAAARGPFRPSAAAASCAR